MAAAASRNGLGAVFCRVMMLGLEQLPPHLPVRLVSGNGQPEQRDEIQRSNNGARTSLQLAQTRRFTEDRSLRFHLAPTEGADRDLLLGHYTVEDLTRSSRHGLIDPRSCGM